MHLYSILISLGIPDHWHQVNVTRCTNFIVYLDYRTHKNITANTFCSDIFSGIDALNFNNVTCVCLIAD